MLAIHAVRDLTCHQKQHDAGQKLRQPGQPQVQRAVRDVVNLPADGHRLHLQRYHDAEARDLVNGKIRMGERDAAGKPEVNGCDHRFLLCHKSCCV
jgi:hypothetical protein